MAEQKTAQQQAQEQFKVAENVAKQAQEQFKVAENAAKQQARQQFKVAENAATNMFRMWNEAFFATTEWSFDMFERGLHYNQELYSQSERTMKEALVSYRGLYEEGMKSWQGYIQGINEIASRTF